jgi:hypothetical protein
MQGSYPFYHKNRFFYQRLTPTTTTKLKHKDMIFDHENHSIVIDKHKKSLININLTNKHLPKIPIPTL